MAAASIKHYFRQLLDVVLVDSSEIATVGVGEATIPTLRTFYRQLGISDVDIMRATKATAKLGIQFNDWHTKGSSFIHPFGLYGQDLQGVQFHHFWLKLKQQNKAADFGAYSLGAMLAHHNKFITPTENPPSSLSVFDWALHFDANLFALFMKNFSIEMGVIHQDEKIIGANICPASGDIQSIKAESGACIEGDLFIDCTGFRGVLIEETLKTGYENWNHWLLCDNAWAVQSKAVGVLASHTKVTAQTAGWQWKIPLQHRNGNGHVYASQFIADDKAQNILFDNINDQEIIGLPRKISFVPGRRKKAWNKNCVALGLAAGFLEPLESTSIALIQTGIEKLNHLLQTTYFNDAIVNEYNETTALEYERVRDFVITHYKLSKRDDSEFWRYCRAMSVPDTLQHKMDLFKANGYVVNYRWEMFNLPSWLAIFMGFDYLPTHYNAKVDLFDEHKLEEEFKKIQFSLEHAVAQAPDHQHFIRQYCAVDDK